jgi:hypothetical protein
MVVLVPIHAVVDPVKLMTGIAFTVTDVVGSEKHWLSLARNLNVACPGPTPNTIPSLLTVAIALLLLVQIPPELGDKVVVVSAHIVLGPDTVTTGFAMTDILCDESE